MSRSTRAAGAHAGQSERGKPNRHRIGAPKKFTADIDIGHIAQDPLTQSNGGKVAAICQQRHLIESAAVNIFEEEPGQPPRMQALTDQEQ